MVGLDALFLSLLLAQIKFDETISLGTLLHLIALLGSVVAIYTKLSQRLSTAEAKLDMLVEWWQGQMERRNGGARQ